MYYFNSKVRYSEIDKDKKMTLCSLLDYFQDCTIFHSESIGLGLNFLEEQNKAWILSSWQVILQRTPVLGEEVRVFTWAYDFKGFYGYRNFKMENLQGDTLAYANSVWVYLDTKTNRPEKLTQEMGLAYGSQEKYPMEYANRKITLPQEMEKLAVYPVHRFHIDTNMHVNNEKYVLIAQEFLPESFQLKELRVEYKKAAVLSDLLHIWIKKQGNSTFISLEDEARKPYALLEFMEECE